MILVDTHVVVWLALDPKQISRKARAAIDAARGNAQGLAISDITLLELATLVAKGRVALRASLESFLEEIESRFVVLPMNARSCARVMGLPSTFPKDPADRIITATALVEGIPLITADREIRKSRVLEAIW
ncbi:MAG: type II toxin-antitoxin system VapC family toxin [Candidatus Acidiferrales bacterium]